MLDHQSGMHQDSQVAANQVEQLSQQLLTVRRQIEQQIFGQSEVITLTLITLLADGHALLIGLPGLGKTRLVEILGHTLGLQTRRIQCTPDLMPADILGSEVLEEGASGKRAFRFMRGPVFCQLLMADEINRASPRTQSALLQAMQERRVSIAGQDYSLPEPFYVLATQNPLEHEGTYPLPEAQLDRFLLQIDVGYPEREAEREMVLATTTLGQDLTPAIVRPDLLQAARQLVRQLPVGRLVVDAVLDLVRGCRPSGNLGSAIAWGPGPRASQALMLSVRARALLQGRPTPSLDDVIALAKPVLRHRMALTFSARAEGMTTEQVIERMSADCLAAF